MDFNIQPMKHDMNWIQFKFRFNDHPTDINWWLDLFLIDTVFREILNKHKPELWRFHRRAGKDSVGHQLSLIVYADKKVVPHIEFIFRNHASIQLLDKNSLIKSYSIEYMEPGIEKTSDKKWPIELQKSWPYFAQGTCQMILGLMDHIPKYKKPSIESVFEIYEPLNDELKDTFTSIGSHAFIHHISALFGYAPIKLNI